MSSTVPCCSAYTFHLVVLAAVDDDQFWISKSLPDDLDLIVIDCATMKHPFNVATVPAAQGIQQKCIPFRQFPSCYEKGLGEKAGQDHHS